MSDQLNLNNLLTEIRACRYCEKSLPLGPNPVLRASSEAKILVIGQAPGTRVHASGIPWDDPSGDRLRDWMGLDKKNFYDESRIAIVPMGFCYPGRGKSGDLPPRPECADLWHQRILEVLPNRELTLLIGQYAQKHYLGKARGKNLTETVRSGQNYLPEFLPLPHPSPRNLLWLRNNPWFETRVVPELKRYVQRLV